MRFNRYWQYHIADILPITDIVIGSVLVYWCQHWLRAVSLACLGPPTSRIGRKFPGGGWHVLNLIHTVWVTVLI